MARVRDGGIQVADSGLGAAMSADFAPLLVGVDRRMTFGAARPVLEAAAAHGPARASLLAGDPSSPRGARVCLSLRRAAARRGESDCWERPLGAAPSLEAGPDAGADAGPGASPSGDTRRQELPPAGLDTSAPLQLSVRLSSARYSIRVQGRPLRFVERSAPSPEEALRATLGSLRRHNDWDHLVMIRVDYEASWPDLFPLLAALRAEGFDAPTILL